MSVYFFLEYTETKKRERNEIPFFGCEVREICDVCVKREAEAQAQAPHRVPTDPSLRSSLPLPLSRSRYIYIYMYICLRLSVDFLDCRYV